MKTLLILRHAKSSWDEPSLPDHDRPLNRRGRHDAPRMGELIRSLDLVPDLVVSSTAVRARTTAELAGEQAGYTEPILLAGDLFHGAAEDYVAVLRTLPPEIHNALIVGHNPDLEELVEDLTGAMERLPTAALAHIALPIADWSELNMATKGELKGLWLPRELT
jgi:phosphohistidine phosphatase